MADAQMHFEKTEPSFRKLFSRDPQGSASSSRPGRAPLRVAAKQFCTPRTGLIATTEVKQNESHPTFLRALHFFAVN
jgi:hypothetical protein